jgi:multicomponent Na+:H+ antiporter subunit C
MTADHFADPVPQSLILTAIVIGFGVLAFSLVLARRVHQSAGSDDIDAIASDSAAMARDRPAGA